MGDATGDRDPWRDNEPTEGGGEIPPPPGDAQGLVETIREFIEQVAPERGDSSIRNAGEIPPEGSEDNAGEIPPEP